MKKAYMAPDIEFEDFSISTSIAAGCEVVVPAPASGTCGYPYEGGGGDTIFVMGVAGCNIKVDDDPENGFCYHVPIASNSLFNS